MGPGWNGMKMDNKNLIIFLSMAKRTENGSPGITMGIRNIIIYMTEVKNSIPRQYGGQMVTKKLKEISKGAERTVSLFFGMKMEKREWKEFIKMLKLWDCGLITMRMEV